MIDFSGPDLARQPAPRPPAVLRLVESGDPGEASLRRARDWGQLGSDLASMSRELLGDLAGITSDEGKTPSLCEGWTVRDVLEHVVSGDFLAIQALTTTFRDRGGSLAAETPVEAGPGEPLKAVLERAGDARRKLLGLIAGLPPDAAGTYVPWVAQEITAFALVQSRLMETWIHGWDMRWPLELGQPFDDRCWLVADLGVRHVPYALRLAGVPSPSIDLRVRLTGTAGGTWNRTIGGPPRSPVSISGPAWAWTTWASQRAPAREGSGHLTSGSDDLSSLVVRTARAFA